MRLTSLLTATLVCAFLYVIILERPVLLAFAGVEQEDDIAETKIRDETKPAVAVVAMKSSARPVTRSIILRGKTEAWRLVDVKAETTGAVVSRPLRKGTMVEESAILCRLDSGTKDASLAEAKARLAEAKAKNRVSAELVERGYAAETTAIARVAALEAAQASVKRAEKEIEQLTIKAPFFGHLESDTAEFGALLQPGMTCARVIQLDPIKLVGFATEQQVRGLTDDALAGARLIDGREVLGRISFIARSADPLTRTFRVEITVPNDDLLIRDGASAEIYIGLAGDVGHLIPQSALTLDDSGRLGVRIIEKDTAMFKPVTIVNESSDGIWITGLGDTADIILLGQEYVTDGRKVTVTYKDDAS
ncbi:MAG: efflux RND transporter periplasmic adaptor subunit [Rhodobacteraceae bacterium]|nr:efflux RND transporter periplasmic adaptor subunit [Paracoccaceae bacterium]